jgi:ribonuclease HI
VEAGELPLDLRRRKLTLQYIIKLKSNPANPAHNYVFQPSFNPLFEAKPFSIPSIGVRAKQHLSDLEISLDRVAQIAISPVPPWILQTPEFIFDLHHSGSKSETPPYIFHTQLNQILSNFDGFTRLYTDGSKDGPSVAAAAICGPRIMVKRLPDHSSIFSAEARAILLALGTIDVSSNDRFLLMTDSMSCLQSMEGHKLNHPLILDIVVRTHHLISTGKRIIFLWIPSHIGIAGNSAADAAAKAALTLPESDLSIPYSDFYPCINTYTARCWQQSWDTEINNKLHSIEPKLKIPKPYHLPRRDELLIHRLRIGHTHLTHAYLLKREKPPECIPCQLPLTVEHILLHCIDFNLVRQKYYSVTTLTELFNSVEPKTIISFIKEIDLYGKL